MKGISFLIPIKNLNKEIFTNIVLDIKNLKSYFENFEFIICYKELDHDFVLEKGYPKCIILKQKNTNDNIFSAINQSIKLSKTGFKIDFLPFVTSLRSNAHIHSLEFKL